MDSKKVMTCYRRATEYVKFELLETRALAHEQSFKKLLLLEESYEKEAQ